MPSIEISIGGQKFVLKGDESEEHLREVAELVRRKIETVRKRGSQMSLQKAAILASFDIASDAIKGRRKAVEYKSRILTKTQELLGKMEAELGDTSESPLS